MVASRRAVFVKGLRDGLPIALGYFAVAFTMGIAAKNAGLNALQATLMSLTNNTSAGQFAALTGIAMGVSYWELGLSQAIINLRYLLMSCALSQKLDPNFSFAHRFLIGYDVTDEIFGVSMGQEGKLNPFYIYGIISIAIPCWACGTCLGVLMGTALPARIVGALSIALYGMFIAVIVPPAKKSAVLTGVILISMGASCLLDYLPLFAGVSSSLKVILITVVVAGGAAVLFPIGEDGLPGKARLPRSAGAQRQVEAAADA